MTINREFDKSATDKTIRKKNLTKQGSADDFTISYESLLPRSSSTRKLDIGTEIPKIRVTPDFVSEL